MHIARWHFCETGQPTSHTKEFRSCGCANDCRKVWGEYVHPGADIQKNLRIWISDLLNWTNYGVPSCEHLLTCPPGRTRVV